MPLEIQRAAQWLTQQQVRALTFASKLRSTELQESVITRSQINGFSAEEQSGARWEAQHDGSSHATLPHDVTAVILPGI
jgi:hypothetical protein